MLYLLDVSGHGLGSALMSVSVQHLMRSQALPGISFYRPEEVLRGLNELFQMHEQNPATSACGMEFMIASVSG